MGIVITFVMLIGLVILRPTPWRAETGLSAPQLLRLIGGFLLVLFGIWNIGYGVQNLSEFWGWAALLSGLVMTSAALLIAALTRLELSQAAWGIIQYRTPITSLLAAFFLLYSVTLIQLNLGFPIIG